MMTESLLLIPEHASEVKGFRDFGIIVWCEIEPNL
jgi:hypothetical protein